MVKWFFALFSNFGVVSIKKGTFDTLRIAGFVHFDRRSAVSSRFVHFLAVFRRLKRIFMDEQKCATVKFPIIYLDFFLRNAYNRFVKAVISPKIAV